jgi:hypothetical protein
MTAQQAADRLIAIEERSNQQAGLAQGAIVLSIISMCGFVAGHKTFGPGIVLWLLGLFAAIPALLMLIGRQGFPSVRFMMAFALAVWLVGPVTWLIAHPRVKAELDYYNMEVRVQQPDGSWKLVPRRIAAPYMLP